MFSEMRVNVESEKIPRHGSANAGKDAIILPDR
jgi:hypothetical protein